jgi:hypothetical protein
MEPSDHDEIPLCNTGLCRTCGTTGGIKQMGETIDQKMVAVHGSSCTPTQLMLIIFFPEDGVGLVPKGGCLLTLAYYAFPR